MLLRIDDVVSGFKKKKDQAPGVRNVEAENTVSKEKGEADDETFGDNRDG